jgi:DNA polymerase III subunit delta
MTFDQIIAELKKKIYHPVYFLHGEEPFYIDEISDFIETNVLTESEKEFNQTVLYGKDVDIPTLISYARRYPMLSSHQVVIVKEAQDIRNLIAKEKDDQPKEKSKKAAESKDLFLEYIQKPTPSTILVLCYKYKTLDKRTRLAKAIEQSSVLFLSKPLYDDKLPQWTTQYVLGKGYRINPKASSMMAENLGNDLSKIANEVNKLLVSMKPGDEITPAMVEDNIGISKEFNIFELQNALGKRNIYKANLIVNYFSSNPKNNPMIMTIAQLYSYFLKLLTYHSLEDRTGNKVATALQVHPYFVGDYENAAKAYSLNHCIRNIGYIRDYDLRSKGVSSSSVSDGSLLKELVFKILH